MSQAQQPDFNIDPYSTSGVELTNIMNRLHQAHISAHSGPGRPPYAVVGTIWLDTTTAPGQLLWFDGANDLPLGGGGAAAGAITNYDNTKTYALGDLVVQGGNIYKNVTAVAAAEPFDPFKWKQIDSGGVVQAITPFDPAASYKAGDMVTNTGMVYVAKAAITTPGPFSATDWNQIAPGTGATGPITLFGATKTYALDDIVVYQGKIFRNIVPVTVPSPFKQTEWVEIDIGGLVQVITAHDPAAVYALNDLVALNGIIYRANAAIPAEPFDPTKWTQIAPASGGGAIDTWVATKNYLQNDIVVHSGHIYRAKAAAPMNATFDATKWEEIGGKQAPDVLTAFSPTMNYTAGQLVVYGSKIYRSNALVNPGPWDGTKWSEIDIGAAPPAGVRLHDVTLPYAQGDLVAHLGHIYRANAALTAKAFDPTDWTQIDLDGLKMPVTFYDPTITYKAGDIIAQGGKLYKADTTVTGPFDPTKWTQIDATNIVQAITNFDSTKTYGQNDLVVDGGSIYRALHATGPGARVTADWQQIDADAIIHPVNDFDQTATYKVDDIVINSGDIYRATKAITAGPFNAADWHKFDEHPIKLYDPTQTYKVGDVVAQGGKIWANKTAVTTPGPFAPLNWFDISHVSISEWDPAGVYAQNDLVTNGGKIYRAKAAIPATATFDPTKWDEIGAQAASQVLTAFSATVPYKQDQLVVEAGKIYRAKADNGPAAFAAANWEEIDIGGEKPQAITIHDVTHAYKKNDLVTHLGNIFQAKVDIPAKPWSAGDWQQIGAGGPIVAFNAADTYVKDDLVVQAGKIYRAKAAVPAGPFDPTQWAVSVAGTNFAKPPDDTIGIDDDLISVSEAIIRNYCFRSAAPARDPAHSFSGGTMNGLVNDVAGSKDYILVRPGPTVQMYIVGKMGSAFPDGTIVHWKVNNKFTWSSHVETKLAKGVANMPPSFSGTSAEWDQMLDDFNANPPNLSSIDVWGFSNRTTPAVRLFAKENGLWEELYGEMDSISTGLVGRTASGAIAAKGFSFEKDKLPIINYVDMHKHRGTYSFGFEALREIIAGTVDSPQGKGIVAIGSWAGRDASARPTTGANSEPSGASVAIGDSAAAQAKTLSGSTVVGSESGVSAEKLIQSSFFGQGGFPGFFLGAQQDFEYNQCTGIGANSLVASGASGKIEKCTSLGADAGHPARAQTPQDAAKIHTLCAGSHNVTLLGFNAEPTGTYTKPSVNQIVLGDHNIQHIYAKVRSISALSDERDKKDITDLSLGLDFINGLRPVSFAWDDRDGSYKGVKSIGFIAQEVLKAENDSGMRDHLQMVDEEVPDKLKMSEGQLIPILTKAVQELSAQVEALKTEIDNLKKSA